MRAFAITLVTLLLISGVALAQPGGEIKVIPEFPGNSDCNLIEQVATVNYVYVVHQAITSASGARFRVDHNWSATTLTPVYPWEIVLDPFAIYTGITLVYPGCELLPYTIAQLPFLPVTPTPPCTVEFHVVPDPGAGSGKIEARDCGGTWVEASAGYSWVVVNQDQTCECYVDPPVGTEESTWGNIKALYR